MSVTATAKRRRRQMAQGYTHLAHICGGSVKGGRPVYPPQKTRSVHESIQRERDKAQREAASKKKKKS